MSGTMLRFVRYTCQGIAIASLGTVGVSHSYRKRPKKLCLKPSSCCGKIPAGGERNAGTRLQN